MISSARLWTFAILLGLLSGCWDTRGAKLIIDAEKGDPKAQCSLGASYNLGLWDVPKDRLKAVFWQRKSAEQGYAQAQFFMGLHYANGEGVAEDQVQAVSWFRKAAEQGYAPAQYKLGNSYYKGRGVSVDYAQAVSWYRKSAELGHAPAFLNLSMCYADGKGVEKDDVESYAYLRIAAIIDREGFVDEYVKNKIALIENIMSKDEIIAGQKRFKELQKEIDAKIAAKEAGK